MPRASTSVATRTSVVPFGGSSQARDGAGSGCGPEWMASARSRRFFSGGAVVGAVARAGEHDDALGAAFLQHGLQELGLEVLDGHHVLLHRVGRFALAGDLDHGGVVQKLAAVLLDGAVDGGAEQKRLAALGRGATILVMAGQKPMSSMRSASSSTSTSTLVR